MKKLYTTLALAAAVALSASAADVKALKFEKNVQTISNEISVEEFAAPIARKVAPAVMKAKPTKTEEILGYYTMEYSRIYGEPGYETGSLSILPGSSANEVYLFGFGNAASEVIRATFDPSNATLSIAANQPVFYSSELGQVYWQHLIISTDERITATNDPMVCEFTENGDIIVPGVNGYLQGWNLGISTTTGFQGYSGGLIRTVTKMLPPAEEGWQNVGNATFTDGWFLTGLAAIGFQQNINFPGWDVRVDRNVANPNIFRLNNPYKDLNTYLNGDIPANSEDYLEANSSLLDGCIEFDVTDPTCVLFTPNVYSGLYTNIWQSEMFFMTNSAGDFVLTENDYTIGMSKEELIEMWKMILEESGESNTLSVFDKNSNTVIVNDAQFKMTGYPLYVNWTLFGDFLKEADPDSFGRVQTPINMTSVIVLPDGATGIDNIITDNTNKTLEYFNLQGVRVENPSNGIYIRRQGNDVQKVYVR